MNRILTALAAASLSASMPRAQLELVPTLPLTRIESIRVMLIPLPSPSLESDRILPDDPIPVLPSLEDGPAPCPGGDGKSCALLGGRAYFSDPFHMTEHDLTWAKAARNPAMITFEAINLLATVADAEGTQACLHAHTCQEANPIFFSHDPSRLRSYSIAMPIVLGSFVWADYMKKKGDGNFAIAVLSAGTGMHLYFAAEGFMSATHGPSANENDGKGFSIALRF